MPDMSQNPRPKRSLRTFREGEYQRLVESYLPPDQRSLSSNTVGCRVPDRPQCSDSVDIRVTGHLRNYSRGCCDALDSEQRNYPEIISSFRVRNLSRQRRRMLAAIGLALIAQALVYLFLFCKGVL